MRDDRSRIGLYGPVEAILPAIGTKNWPKYKCPRTGEMFWLRDLLTQRFRLLGRQPYCACCGLRGRYFAVDCLTDGTRRYHAHLNLYGINAKGEEVMLTMDHVIPKNHGGKTHKDNLQTLCKPCNACKKDHLWELDELRRKRFPDSADREAMRMQLRRSIDWFSGLRKQVVPYCLSC